MALNIQRYGQLPYAFLLTFCSVDGDLVLGSSRRPHLGTLLPRAATVVWLSTSALAFARARQRRFNEHRAWMMRNYSLTLAAATVRLASLPFLLLTRDPVVAITCTFWS